MPWNWELAEWPKFTYEPSEIIEEEKQFLLGVGNTIACLKHIETAERNQFVVEMLSLEGMKSSKIEGEILDRASLQSSIQKHFGLPTQGQEKSNGEARMAKLLCDVYETFDAPLSHEMLWKWHAALFHGEDRIDAIGKYRNHAEPMQIVSNRLGSPKIYFEAPRSKKVYSEMEAYIKWFNANQSQPILGRAAIAHVYFESIHPFEDGNGRIGRILVEKVLSQGVGKPTLIAVSKVLENRKKEYDSALERCNRTLEVQPWVEFFAEIALQAQKESIEWLYFLIQKAKILSNSQINARQEKVLLRMFAQGPEGFKGGLSADKYIAMTKTSKATATRDLNDLVEKGILVKTGELRHTRYWLNLPVN